jgi:catechol 2,3-dioxygenase-like lactoylglutathione lyase family enzyme
MTNPNGVHHLAISTTRMRDQLEFFTEVLGAGTEGPVLDARYQGHIPRLCKAQRLLLGGVRQGPKVSAGEGPIEMSAEQWHIAFNVDTMDDLLCATAFATMDTTSSAPVDHGFCNSSISAVSRDDA